MCWTARPEIYLETDQAVEESDQTGIMGSLISPLGIARPAKSCAFFRERSHAEDDQSPFLEHMPDDLISCVTAH